MLTLLPTPIGNIAYITYRTLTILESCELILCEDTRVTKHLLSILKERYSLTLSFKDIYSFHQHNGKERLEFLAERIKNERVVLVAIDLNRDVCEMVSAKLGVPAIAGNATDVATLEEAEIGRTDVAVGMMRQSADNLAFCLLAKSAGAKRIITRMANPK
ncbi:MAG TPA: hypothetical protein ENL00_02345, partial [Nitratifractor sp.]|nr:hypothetical protein [Nitratifractor sp.]